MIRWSMTAETPSREASFVEQSNARPVRLLLLLLLLGISVTCSAHRVSLETGLVAGHVPGRGEGSTGLTFRHEGKARQVWVFGSWGCI